MLWGLKKQSLILALFLLILLAPSLYAEGRCVTERDYCAQFGTSQTQCEAHNQTTCSTPPCICRWVGEPWPQTFTRDSGSLTYSTGICSGNIPPPLLGADSCYQINVYSNPMASCTGPSCVWLPDYTMGKCDRRTPYCNNFNLSAATCPLAQLNSTAYCNWNGGSSTCNGTLPYDWNLDCEDTISDETDFIYVYHAPLREPECNLLESDTPGGTEGCIWANYSYPSAPGIPVFSLTPSNPGIYTTISVTGASAAISPTTVTTHYSTRSTLYGETVYYRTEWYRNGIYVTTNGNRFPNETGIVVPSPLASTFPCTTYSCADGDVITARVNAWYVPAKYALYIKYGQYNSGCNPLNLQRCQFMSGGSSQMQVTIIGNVPPTPVGPVIANITPLGVIGQVSCTQNCPPIPLPKEPQTGNDAVMQYVWLKNAAEVGGWSSTLSNFDCSTNSCIEGNTVALRSRACNATLSCSNYAESAPLTVAGLGGCGLNGATCAVLGDCCSGYCNTTAVPHICATAPPACTAIGGGCALNGDCCSNYCNTTAATPVCASITVCGGSGNWYDNIYFWTGLAVIIGITFLGLAYMAAKAFEIHFLDAWVKIELQEIFASAIIAVFCVVLIASVNSAAAFLTGETGGTDINAVVGNYLRNTIYADGQAIYSKIGAAYFNTAKVASYSYTAGLSIDIASVSYSSSPASGLSPLVAQAGQAMDAVSNFMLLAASQFAFLNFFAGAATVMLPVGIFLRSFSLTRKVGGVVLAAVIATSVIYPASFLVSKEVYSAYRADMLRHQELGWSDATKNPPLASVVCSPIMQATVQGPAGIPMGEIGWWLVICTVPCLALGPGFSGCMYSCQGLVYTAFYIIKSTFPIVMYYVMGDFSSDLNSDDLISGYYQPLRDYALPAASKYTVLSLVSFLIPLIITIIMLRNLAITFGGEPQLYGLSKLV